MNTQTVQARGSNVTHRPEREGGWRTLCGKSPQNPIVATGTPTCRTCRKTAASRDDTITISAYDLAPGVTIGDTLVLDRRTGRVLSVNGRPT